MSQQTTATRRERHGNEDRRRISLPFYGDREGFERDTRYDTEEGIDREYEDINDLLNTIGEEIAFMRNQINTMQELSRRRARREKRKEQKRRQFEDKVEQVHRERTHEFKLNMIYQRAVSLVRSDLRAKGYSEEFLDEHEEMIEERVESFLFD